MVIVIFYTTKEKQCIILFEKDCAAGWAYSKSVPIVMDGFENDQQKYTVHYKCVQNSVSLQLWLCSSARKWQLDERSELWEQQWEHRHPLSGSH